MNELNANFFIVAAILVIFLFAAGLLWRRWGEYGQMKRKLLREAKEWLAGANISVVKQVEEITAPYQLLFADEKLASDPYTFPRYTFVMAKEFLKFPPAVSASLILQFGETLKEKQLPRTVPFQNLLLLLECMPYFDWQLSQTAAQVIARLLCLNASETTAFDIYKTLTLPGMRLLIFQELMSISPRNWKRRLVQRETMHRGTRSLLLAHDPKESRKVIINNPELISDEGKRELEELLKLAKKESDVRVVSLRLQFVSAAQGKLFDFAIPYLLSALWQHATRAHPLYAEIEDLAQTPILFNDHLDDRIKCCKEILARLDQSKDPELWAAVQAELGASLEANI